MTGIQFTTVTFRPGYAMDEVDSFLARAERALRTGDGSVTPEEVLEQRFTPTRFSEGYSMDEVDDYLDTTLRPELQEQRSEQDPGADGAGPTRTREASGKDASAAGGVLHPAEKRPGLLTRVFGVRR